MEGIGGEARLASVRVVERRRRGKAEADGVCAVCEDENEREEAGEKKLLLLRERRRKT